MSTRDLAVEKILKDSRLGPEDAAAFKAKIARIVDNPEARQAERDTLRAAGSPLFSGDFQTRTRAMALQRVLVAMELEAEGHDSWAAIAPPPEEPTP